MVIPQFEASSTGARVPPPGRSRPRWRLPGSDQHAGHDHLHLRAGSGSSDDPSPPNRPIDRHGTLCQSDCRPSPAQSRQPRLASNSTARTADNEEPKQAHGRHRGEEAAWRYEYVPASSVHRKRRDVRVQCSTIWSPAWREQSTGAGAQSIKLPRLSAPDIGRHAAEPDDAGRVDQPPAAARGPDVAIGARPSYRETRRFAR